jgi:predicted amidohydrolase
MKSKVKISAVQMKILSAKTNLPKILDYIRKAAMIRSDIICFPECSFNPNCRKPSLEKDLAVIQKECKLRGIYAIMNGYFRDKNGDVYNRTYLIDNNGKILGFYDKIYLWKTEINKIIKRGKDVKVVETSLGRIGFCTCWDLFFPDIFEKLKQQGAEIIFCPSYWNDNLKKESKFLEYTPTVLAYLYMVFFVYCNSFLKGETSISQIAAPWGELAEVKYKEEMISANLYSNRLNKLKNHFNSVLWGRKL